MISFNLKCTQGHGFEGWFGSSEDFDAQREQGLVSCPFCGDATIAKALMTPNLGAKSSSGDTDTPASNPANTHKNSLAHRQKMVKGLPQANDAQDIAQAWKTLRALQKKIRAECDFVGERFAEEARKIHYGETDPRGIYGQSSRDDIIALEEEGISVSSVPWLADEH